MHENARAFFRFPLTSDAPTCELEEATLLLHAGGHTEGRTLVAQLLEESWKESTLTWWKQPKPLLSSPVATTDSGEGYREFDVKAHVEAIFAGAPNHGWVIRDQVESDPEGGDQTFDSRELPQDPPDVTLPVLVLRFEAAEIETPQPPRSPSARN